MAAVECGEIRGGLHLGESRFHWFLNLHTQSSSFSLSPDDWKIVEKCACEAQMAGVISEPEAVLAAVLGGQDLLNKTAKLQNAGQSMLTMISEVLAKQAENDVEMESKGKEMSRKGRMQRLNALLTAVFSFAPLVVAAVANSIGAVAEASSLLESMIGTGVCKVWFLRFSWKGLFAQLVQLFLWMDGRG